MKTPDPVTEDIRTEDLEAELEALFAAAPRPNREHRRANARNRTRFQSALRRNGRFLRWRPTQVPEPLRVERRRRRNKRARASRKANR